MRIGVPADDLADKTALNAIGLDGDEGSLGLAASESVEGTTLAIVRQNLELDHRVDLGNHKNANWMDPGGQLQGTVSRIMVSTST